MSKLAELVRRTTRIEAAPLGFGVAQRKTPPTMLLVAVLSERWTQASDALAAGADVLLLAGSPNENELAEVVAAAEGRPCGLRTPQIDAEGAAQLREAGIDFLVVEPQTPAATLQDEGLGFLLHLKEELTDAQLRTLDALPWDAILLERQATPMTIEGQLELQRIGGLARRALLVSVPGDANPIDLLPLRDAGASLIALDLKQRDALDALRRLREAIDGLPARRVRRQEERAEVALPRATASETVEEDEDAE